MGGEGRGSFWILMLLGWSTFCFSSVHPNSCCHLEIQCHLIFFFDESFKIIKMHLDPFHRQLCVCPQHLAPNVGPQHRLSDIRPHLTNKRFHIIQSPKYLINKMQQKQAFLLHLLGKVVKLISNMKWINSVLIGNKFSIKVKVSKRIKIFNPFS